MAYRRSYRRSRYSRPRFVRRSKVQARRRYWRKLTRPELKTVVASQNTQEINNGGTFQLLTGITPGTSDTTRVGNKILLKYLWLKGNIRTIATSVDQTVRLVIIEDRAPTGALPAWTDVFNTVDVYSFRNRDRLTRFKVYYDKMFLINRPSEENSSKPLKKFLKIRRPVYYNDTGGATIATAQKSCFYIAWVGTEVTGTTCALIDYNTQVGFTDL